MNCKLIFYDARKTSLCERALQKSFSELDLSLVNTAFAPDSMSLCKQLKNAFDDNNVVFVIGVLGTGGDFSTENVFSRVLADTTLDEYKKIKNDFGEDGYVFRVQKQLLILLPDEPAQIENIMQGPLGRFIKKTENARVYL